MIQNQSFLRRSIEIKSTTRFACLRYLHRTFSTIFQSGKILLILSKNVLTPQPSSTVVLQSPNSRRSGFFFALTPLLILTSCTVGPDYQKPTEATPTTFKEMTPEEAVIAKAWKPTQPNDAVTRGKWWEVYQDPELNALEDKVNLSNQNIRQAEANYQVALALVHQNRAANYPIVNLAPSTGYASLSKNATNGNQLASHESHTDFVVPVEASYLLDLWGSIHRTIEASTANAQASFAQLESARLSYQAQLAQDYFTLHGYDAEKALLTQNLATDEKDLELTKNLYNSGVDSSLDVSLAQTQIETTRAQLADVILQRAQTEHAMATLIGQGASTFSLPEKPLSVRPPNVPLSLPSTLLERRPDIATAERQMAAANAEIGIADAGYYPTVLLSASGGFEAYHLAELFSWPSLAWSVGASLTQPLFNGGKTHAEVDQAKANYDATLANYRQTVLTALQQIEDQLVALHNLEIEATAQDSAVKNTTHSVEILENQYQAGTTSYLNVITIKLTQTSAELNSVNVQIRQMIASVALIEALGGSWNNQQNARSP